MAEAEGSRSVAGEEVLDPQNLGQEQGEPPLPRRHGRSRTTGDATTQNTRRRVNKEMVMMNRSELVALMEAVVYRARDKRPMEKPSRASGPIGGAPKYGEASAVEEGDTFRRECYGGLVTRIFLTYGVRI